MKRVICSLVVCLLVMLGDTLLISANQEMSQNNRIGVGPSHVATIDKNNVLWSWGWNGSGQLGNGKKNDMHNIPIRIMDDVKSLSVVSYISPMSMESLDLEKGRTAVIKSDGSLWLWGDNHNGAIGNGSYSDCLTPSKIMDDVNSVSICMNKGAAVKSDGSLWMWGWIDILQRFSNVPVKIMDDVSSVSVADGHNAVIKNDGSLWMWGSNSQGQLGNGTKTDSNVPLKIMDEVKSIDINYQQSAAITNDGKLWTWGHNAGGLGDSGGNSQRSTPVKIMDNIKSVSLGWENSAAIKNDSSLWTWGYNGYGLLGNGTNNHGSRPMKISSNVQSISVGMYSVTIIKEDESIWTWGMNYYSQLGNGDTKDSTKVPTKIFSGITEDAFNLDYGSTEIKGPSIDLGPWSFPLFTMDTGVNLGSLSMKQKIDPGTKTIYQSIGVDESVVDKEGDAYWKGTYKNLKDIANGFGKKTDREFYNNFRSARKYLKQHKMKLGVSCDGSAYGYCEYSYALGQPVFKEGGLVVLVEPSVELMQRIPQTANICYIRFKLTGSFGGKFTLSVEDTNINDPKLLAEITASVNAQLGIGADVLIANVEGGLEGEIGTNITMGNNTASLEDALRVYLTAKVYAKASIAGWESQPLEIPFVDWQMYPQTDTMSLMSLNDYDDYCLPSRDYLDGISTMALDDTNIAFSQSSVYPYGNPKIVTLEDGRLMALWIGDNGTKSTANRTTLMYTLRDSAGNWGTPQAVCESGRSDLNPVVSVEGNNVYVLWSNGSEVYNDDITMTEMLTKINLVYSRFDGTSFSAPVVLNTENSGKMQQLPALDADNGTVMVSWVENSENDPYLASGTNTLITRSLKDGAWGDATNLNSDVGYTGSTAVDCANQCIYYSVDADPTTEGDETINAVALDGSTTSLGAGTTLKATDGNIFAVNNGTLWTVANGTITDTGVPCTTDYDVVGNTVLFTQKNGFKNEVYTTTKDADGTWSTAVPLTAYNSFLRYFDATVDGNGEIILAMDKVGVDDSYEGIEGTSPYGTTDFIITSAEDRYDLSVDPTLYYDTTALAPGATIDVTAEVTNTSTQAVDSLKLTWLDANDREIGTATTKSQSIGVGETAEVKTTYTLPTPLSHQSVKLKIEAEGVTEDSLDNNTASMEYGFSDVALESGKLTKNADGTGTITVDVKNTGVDTAEGVTVDLYKDGTSGEKLSQQVVGSVASGQSKTLTYVLAQDKMACADEYDGKLFYLDAQSTSVESDYGNNTNELLLDPVVATEIALDQEAVTLTAGDTAQLKATPSPVDAVSTTHWVSDDTTVATVDDTGKITAVAAGTATITAIASEATKQCVVTVEAGPVGKLRGRTLSLQGDLSINFYMDLDETVDPTTISIKFWKEGAEGQKSSVPYNADFYLTVEGQTYYGFNYRVSAKEMGDTIKAQLYVKTENGEEASGEVMEYSAQTYANNKLNASSTDENLKALMRSMLNYGSAAQQLFDYQTTSLANSILSEEEKQVPAASIGDEYKGTITSGTVSDPKAVIAGNSLVLRSQTYLRYYITLDDTVNVNAVKLKYHKKDGAEWSEVAFVKDNTSDYYYADIKNISASALKDMYEAYVVENGVQISETRVYGPMSYARNQLSSENEALVQTINAMVDYCDKAKVWFNK